MHAYFNDKNQQQPERERARVRESETENRTTIISNPTIERKEISLKKEKPHKNNQTNILIHAAAKVFRSHFCLCCVNGNRNFESTLDTEREKKQTFVSMKQTQLKFIAKMLKDREKLIRIAKGFMHARKFTAIVYCRFHAFTTDLTKAD